MAVTSLPESAASELEIDGLVWKAFEIVTSRPAHRRLYAPEVRDYRLDPVRRTGATAKEQGKMTPFQFLYQTL